MDFRHELMDGEEFVEEMSPHPLSFLGLYLIFLYPIALGIVFVFFHEDLVSYFSNLLMIEAAGIWTTIAVWWVLLIVPAIIIALLKITWKWLALYLAITTGLTLLKIYSWVEIAHMNYILVVIGLVGLVISEYYRRQHHFYLTNQRIITELDFFGKKTRSLMYSRVNDLVVQKSFLGKWFDYGTILPITASGFGLTSDMSMAGGGVGGSLDRFGGGLGLGFGGLKGIQDARGRPYYILYGVSESERIYRKISEFIRQTENTPYLKKISSDVETLTNQKRMDQGGTESEAKEPQDNKTN
ncbi:putative membrane protein containing bPH2 domain [Methanonatronarchaeum thermophilum]|uniref:Putative membrane protein containing bPH2 domain n=1 Tax=Methanonatronarchaeum thermophilum TaxID=1927129 RepID=A0A1Y3G9S8_9EURY|nr:PH domain-containing protein [Methanonatronarchaeum thermophilum]OUJ18202.1 putative membrane protein containing bPH2 domain [Methanonatronarchaeum thermophilum]